MLTWMLRLTNHLCALDQTLGRPIRGVSLIFARKFTLPLVLRPVTTEDCLRAPREWMTDEIDIPTSTPAVDMDPALTARLMALVATIESMGVSMSVIAITLSGLLQMILCVDHPAMVDLSVRMAGLWIALPACVDLMIHSMDAMLLHAENSCLTTMTALLMVLGVGTHLDRTRMLADRIPPALNHLLGQLTCPTAPRDPFPWMTAELPISPSLPVTTNSPGAPELTDMEMRKTLVQVLT